MMIGGELQKILSGKREWETGHESENEVFHFAKRIYIALPPLGLHVERKETERGRERERE